MTTPTAPYAMVQAGSSDWRALRALGWTTTDVTPGAFPARAEWLHLEPPPGGSQIAITTEPPEETPEEAPAGLIWREPVTVRPEDVLLVTAPDCLPEDIGALREQIERARRRPEQFLIAANYDIYAQVIRFEEPLDDYVSCLYRMWQKGRLTPPALASAIQSNVIRARAGSEVLFTRLALIEDAAEKAGAPRCHRCGTPHVIPDDLPDGLNGPSVGIEPISGMLQVALGTLDSVPDGE